MDMILDIFRKHLPVGVKVWVFGSRADWTTRDSSDLDLALEGDSALDCGVVVALETAFEESDIPYKIDVTDLNQVTDGFRQIVDAQKIIFPTTKDGGNTENSWHMVPLRDVVDLRISGADKKTKKGERPVRLCNYTDVYNNIFINADMDFMTATATENEIFKCLLSDGDVIIIKDSEKHDDIGVPALVCGDIPNLVCGHHLAILRPTQKIDGNYLYYALNTVEARHQFQSHANGTTRFGLRKTDIGFVEIPLPPLDEQRSIAHTLRTLDDKIEMNRRMNQTLEEMVRTLFKSWFVDFDPVRAKMDGRWEPDKSLPGLPAHLYDLFPDSLVGSELGKIPKGWEIRCIGDIAKVLGGTTPGTKISEHWHNGTHCRATHKDMSALSATVLLDTERKIADAGLSKTGSGLLPPNTLLVPSREPIGHLAISEMPAAINQGFIAMLPYENMSNLFLLFWCKFFHSVIVGHANGSTFPEINKTNFQNISLVMPNMMALSEFECLARPLYRRIVTNEYESHILMTQRDVLLPKLVSGEIRVRKFAGRMA